MLVYQRVMAVFNSNVGTTLDDILQNPNHQFRTVFVGSSHLFFGVKNVVFDHVLPSGELT